MRYAATGPATRCGWALWRGDVFFYNQGASPAEIKLLGLSNGVLAEGTPTTLTLSPGAFVALSDIHQPPWFPKDGGPGSGPFFFVLHLDVPNDVVVENRDEVVIWSSCTIQTIEPYVKVSLPVVRSLTPAGVAQVKIGTDAGSTPARQNVAIYNAGAELATAHVEVRRACDGTILDQRSVTIVPNTIIQVNGLATSTGEPFCPPSSVPGYARYTVVTVNQPSFSVVSTITDPQPSSGGLVPRVELAIAMSTLF